MKKKLFLKKVLLIVSVVLFMDQSLKVFIKTHFQMGETMEIFPWFSLSFVENPGMAYGIRFGSGYVGKIILSLLRLFLVVLIFLCIYKRCKKGASNYFIIPMSMIFSGAIGNIIDSAFYGLIFDRGMVFNSQQGTWLGYDGVANFGFPGYSFFMGGSVVDMFYFPIINSYWPQWVPFIGGERFEFFKPVFNLADTFISIGGSLMVVFGTKVFQPTMDSFKRTSKK